ncbi:MAG: hypothetical protein PVG66_02185 [Chromatiales bacterium]
MISNKFDRNENPDWEPDALVEVTFFDRTTPALNGFRPQYKVMADYLTSTHHWFIENGEALPNEPTQAFVKFITPEAYPNCLNPGMEIEVCEGSRVFGTAKVLEVYNEQLLKHS